MTDQFTKDGRLIIPVSTLHEWRYGAAEEDKVTYVILEAYCPKGCSVIDESHPISGYPGLRMRFARPDMEGEMVLSAMQGDLDKLVLRGSLVDGVKDELYCPHCGVPLAKLVNCDCSPGADMVVLGMTPALDFNNAIAFCNVTGCRNSTFVRAGQVIRRVYAEGI